MTEIWKDIPGYEGHYKVSNLGRVKSIKYNKEKILTPYKEVKRFGYLSVYLRTPGNKKTMKVHRLVALAFIPNPNNLPEINHRDENKENNCVDNLEWCTSKYNANYGTKLTRLSKILGMKVAQYSKNGELINTFDSQQEAASKTRCIQTCISDCINGKIKTHRGFIWKKIEV